MREARARGFPEKSIINDGISRDAGIPLNIEDSAGIVVNIVATTASETKGAVIRQIHGAIIIQGRLQARRVAEIEHAGIGNR